MDSEPAHQAPTESDLDMPIPPTTADQIRPGLTISGPFFPEAMEIRALKDLHLDEDVHIS